MAEKWRLLRDEATAGARNMAVDEALLDLVDQPTLRLYAWQPHALSLGYFQEAQTVDFAACAREGIDVVRRPTGGRTILHAQELTYAIVLPPQHSLTRVSVSESYRALSGGLLRALILLGLPASLAKKPPVGFGRPAVRRGEASDAAACFDAPSWYELVVAGHKVIGSAQVRRRGALLQHGSIPLYLDAEHLFRLLQFRNTANRTRAAQRLAQSAAGLAQLADRPLGNDEVAAAVISGFEEEFKMHLAISSLTEEERARAASLESQHRRPAWVLHREGGRAQP